MASPMGSFSYDLANDNTFFQQEVMQHQNWQKQQNDKLQQYQYPLQHRYHCHRQQQQQQLWQNQPTSIPSPSANLYQNDQFFYTQSASPSVNFFNPPLANAPNEGLDLGFSAHFQSPGNSLGPTVHGHSLPGYPPHSDAYRTGTVASYSLGTGLAIFPDDGAPGMVDDNDCFLSKFNTSDTPAAPDANNGNGIDFSYLSTPEAATVYFGSPEASMPFSLMDIEAAESPLPTADIEPSQPGQKRKRPAQTKMNPPESHKKTKSQQDHSADSRSDTLELPTQNDLGRHDPSKHGPYPCLLNFTGGCSKFFKAKNEWKRHCLTQHIVVSYYACPEEGCAGKSDSFFLRKDLFKAHLDRVHTPVEVRKEHKDRRAAEKERRDALRASGPKQRKRLCAAKKASNGTTTSTAIPFPTITYSQEYRDTCNKHQAIVKDGLRPRVKLPESITCQAPGCECVFTTKNAFHKFMEHVGKHLERIASGDEADHAFGVELAPYFAAIGILKASHSTPESSSAAWELVSVNGETKVDVRYVPDATLDLLGPAIPVVSEDGLVPRR